MVFVARLTVDGPFHKGLLRNIQLSQTVDYDMHIHIQYRFDQEIRNVLEYCSSVPAEETEENAG